MNGIFSLDWASVGRALVSAIVFAILGALVALVSKGDFNVFTADWLSIVKNMVNVGFMAAVVTLGNDLLSTNDGSILGVTADRTPSK